VAETEARPDKAAHRLHPVHRLARSRFQITNYRTFSAPSDNVHLNLGGYQIGMFDLSVNRYT